MSMNKEPFEIDEAITGDKGFIITVKLETIIKFFKWLKCKLKGKEE